MVLQNNGYVMEVCHFGKNLWGNMKKRDTTLKMKSQWLRASSFDQHPEWDTKGHIFGKKTFWQNFKKQLIKG